MQIFDQDEYPEHKMSVALLKYQ